MCVVAIKYFKGTGWVGVKNRDRNYKPTIHIKQSFRDGIERLYIWDEKTRYAEGLNEFGVCIMSAAVAVKKDEQEGTNDNPDRVFYSPDGKRIRKALLEKNVDKALKKLIELQIPGNTLVFDNEKCYLLEAAFKDEELKEYEHYVQEVKKDETVVRTNHGIYLKYSGYQDDEQADEDERKARKSSEARLKQARKDLRKVTDPRMMLDAISSVADKNPQMNPLRLSNTHGKSIMVTTGQIMLTPSELTLHYRPIWSDIEFDFNKLDDPAKKTSFEVISSKKLLSFKEHLSQ